MMWFPALVFLATPITQHKFGEHIAGSQVQHPERVADILGHGHKNMAAAVSSRTLSASLLLQVAETPSGPRSEQRQPVVQYRLKGKSVLYPSYISDDGVRTYIEWPLEAELPAVFAINEQGQEILVDGYMREGRYTIDRVYGALVFRLDKDVATATRTAKKL